MPDARLRAAPGFRLVPFDQLAPADLARLGPIEAGGEWAGVLLPESPGWRRIHLVTHRTARLLRSMPNPRPRPPSLSPADARRFVLDGILELHHAGQTRSGPAAHPLLFPGPSAPEALGVLGALSLAGIRYATSLGSSDPLLLADRLYRYNSRPASPSWRRSLRNPHAVTRFLQADRNGRAGRARQGRDAVLESPAGRGAWRVWEHTGAREPEAGAATFKLYVSPDPRAVGEALAALLGQFERKAAPFSAKVGRDLPNLLRPDKLVAYFARRSDLFEAAARLARELAGMPAQGVPFTAGFTDDPLLSWALDPPDGAEPPGPRRRTSWRGWVTTRLAGALGSALAAGNPIDPCRYALDRVSLDGVDPSRWIRPEWDQAIPVSRADH